MASTRRPLIRGLKSLLIAYRAPSAGILIGFVAIKAPTVSFMLLVTYITWLLISSRVRLRSARKVQFTPLHAVATFLLFCAGLWGFAGGVVFAAGDQPISVLVQPYLQATIAWLLLWAHAKREAVAEAKRKGGGDGRSTTVPM